MTHSFSLRIGAAAAIVLVTGCGSQDDDGAPNPPRTDPQHDASADATGSHPQTDARADAADAQTPPAAPLVNVLTQHNDNARTGANLQEEVLTTSNVNPTKFGKLFCRNVDDEIYGQPLIVTGVDIPRKGKRDAVYVATVNDTVYAFDANDPKAADPLWSRSFLSQGVVPPRNTDLPDACDGKYTDVSGNMGILSTPVIDVASGTMYLVARTKENGSLFVQKLHALDIVTGAERAKSPVKIDVSVPGTGEGGTTITFDARHQNQRAALLLLDGLVYIGWS